MNVNREPPQKVIGHKCPNDIQQRVPRQQTNTAILHVQGGDADVCLNFSTRNRTPQPALGFDAYKDPPNPNRGENLGSNCGRPCTQLAAGPILQSSGSIGLSLRKSGDLRGRAAGKAGSQLHL